MKQRGFQEIVIGDKSWNQAAIFIMQEKLPPRKPEIRTDQIEEQASCELIFCSYR